MAIKDSYDVPAGAPRLLNHLTDEEIALCAHEMVTGSYPCSIPPGMHEHLNNCETCYTEVLEFYNLINDDTSVMKAVGIKESTAKQLTLLRGDGYWGRVTGFIGRHKWIAATAASVVIITVALMYAVLWDAPSAENLFYQYHSPYQDVITSKSSGGDRQLLQALFYYNTGNYEQAIALFTDGLDKHPKNDDYLFYLAGSYLAHGSYPEAIATFSLLQDPTSRYYKPARWYLALACLAAGKKDDSQRLLQNICDDGGFYATHSCEILRKLGKP